MTEFCSTRVGDGSWSTLPRCGKEASHVAYLSYGEEFFCPDHFSDGSSRRLLHPIDDWYVKEGERLLLGAPRESRCRTTILRTGILLVSKDYVLSMGKVLEDLYVKHIKELIQRQVAKQFNFGTIGMGAMVSGWRATWPAANAAIQATSRPLYFTHADTSAPFHKYLEKAEIFHQYFSERTDEWAEDYDHEFPRPSSVRALAKRSLKVPRRPVPSPSASLLPSGGKRAGSGAAGHVRSRRDWHRVRKGTPST